MSYPKDYLEYCRTIATKWTSLRKSVLYILWSLQKPLKAYEILELLSKNNPSIQVASIYRALDYFLEAGIVHKIESIQSYTLCSKPDEKLASELLMVCNHCRKVKEVYDVRVHAFMQELSMRHHFHLSNEGIELKGLCALCENA